MGEPQSWRAATDWLREEIYMNEISRKQIGRIGLTMAINYFTIKGYTISLPINDTQWYDLIIEKDGIFETVQCKATQTSDGTIDFRSTGGTKGVEYDNLKNHSELDWLFCVDKDLNMWLFPVKELNNNRQITLRTEPTKNNQGFQTYKFQVQSLDVAP